MPSPSEIMARMDALTGVEATAGIGTGRSAPTSSDLFGAEEIPTWIRCCEIVMRQKYLREQTDWEFAHQPDIDQDGDNILTGAVTLYGILYKTTAVAADILCCYDATSGALDLGSAAAATIMVYLEMELAPANNRYGSAVFPHGVVFTTGLRVGADLAATGGDPSADDNDAWFLFRDL